MGAHKHYAKYFILANIFLTIGLLLNYVLPNVISQIIDKQIALTPQSKTFPKWKEPPVPIYQKFYFYNVTNAQFIEQFGHKPQLDEIGPFTYRVEYHKRDIEYDDDGNVITYKQFKTWHFEPSMSITSDQLLITTLNAPLAITLSLIQSSSQAIRLLVTFSLDGLSDGFFTRRTIKQLLFDGYPDLLTTFGPLLNTEMLSQGGHFGYMNARNNSLDGIYEINTGEDDISKLNTINKFNGRKRLNYWLGNGQSTVNTHHNNHHTTRIHQHNHCNSLNGSTTGELFPPMIDSSSSPDQQQASKGQLKMFQPDFCRVWPMDMDREFELDCGLKVRRFKASRDVFRNFTDLPENSCYIQPSATASARSSRQQQHQTTGETHRGNRLDKRQQQRQQVHPRPHHSRPTSSSSNTDHPRVEWPAGVFTLAPCKFNAPIFMSMPHFLDADSYYNSNVNGLEPNPELHDFYVDLEPRTGSPVTMAARVQLNIAISKPPGLVRFRYIPEIMFPVFWQEVQMNLSRTVIDELLVAARGAQEANIRIAFCFLILGMTILVTTLIFYAHSILRK